MPWLGNLKRSIKGKECLPDSFAKDNQ
ncbi:hypothetical protein CDAR_426411, partial [Caerostris darwini]